MKILVLSTLYPRPNRPYYGIFVHRQVKYLKKLGYHITVLSAVPWSPRILYFKDKWQKYGEVPKQVDWQGMRVYYPRYLRLPGAWFRGQAGYAIYKSIYTLVLEHHRIHPFEIIHSNFLLPDGLAGIYLGQKLNVPTICTVHGSDGVTHPYENPLNLYFARKVIRQSTQIITVSHALKRVVEKIELPTRQIRTVYYGVDFENKNLTPRNFSQHLKTPYILFVGTDIYRKGLLDLLIAFAKLLDKIEHNLVIVGAPKQEIEQLDFQLVEHMAKRLIIVGTLAPEKIPAYMKNCTLFVLPSYVEGLPNVILEAMAYAKPVIATDVMGIPEEVIDGVTGLLVEPGDISGLVEAIHTLVNNPSRAEEMGKLGKKRVSEQFTWERNTQQIIEIYHNVLDS